MIEAMLRLLDFSHSDSSPQAREQLASRQSGRKLFESSTPYKQACRVESEQIVRKIFQLYLD